MGQKYYHFILLAKDNIGYRALKELSSIAWMNSYYDRRLERVPTLKSELANIMKNYKGHVIATTACIGGELGVSILNLTACEEVNDNNNAQRYHNQIVDFIKFCINVFGEDDFYIEAAPAASPEQIVVNKRLWSIAHAFNIKMCVGNDAHYLTKEDRYVHKAYLKSKDGEREVDSFYEFCYLKTEDEARAILQKSFTDEQINYLFSCSNTIANKCEFFSLESHQSVPEVEVTNYEKNDWSRVPGLIMDNFDFKYKEIQRLIQSDNIQERYWIQECMQAIDDKKIGADPRYWDRLEEEARVKRIIGEKLDTCMFAYPNTLKHYVDLFWECGSTVGAGRGSACAALNHYLLGITQLDPIEWDLPFWR